MFKCDFCGKASEPGEPLTLVPVELRDVVYVNHKIDFETEEEIEIVSRGKEIAQEKRACQACAHKVVL